MHYRITSASEAESGEEAGRAVLGVGNGINPKQSNALSIPPKQLHGPSLPCFRVLGLGLRV